MNERNVDVEINDINKNTTKVIGRPTDTAPANHTIDAVVEIIGKARDTGLINPTLVELRNRLASLTAMHPTSVKNKLYSAAKYGFIALQQNPEKKRNEVIMLPLGEAVLDPARSQIAKAEAFLNVPVYRAVFLRYRDQPFPSHDDLEKFMREDLHMAISQMGNVRQVLIRSAEMAGLLDQSREHFVLPAGVSVPQDSSSLLIGGQSMSQSPTTQDVSHGNEIDTSADTVIVPPKNENISIPSRNEGHSQPEVMVPDPALIEWWLKKRPISGKSSKAKWDHWLKTLSDALELEFDTDKGRAED